MSVLVIDLDPIRRPLLADCVAQASGGIEPKVADLVPDVIALGTLLICHVGDRQHEHEARSLGQKLRTAITVSKCTVAGFTGGHISPHFLRQMPPQGRDFVINDRASSGEVNELLGNDVERLVGAWKHRNGVLTGQSLAEIWIGYDPALEAILEILSDVLKGEVSPNGVDDVLEQFKTFGILGFEDMLTAALNAPDDIGRSAGLVQLRDQLFSSYSRRGLPG